MVLDKACELCIACPALVHRHIMEIRNLWHSPQFGLSTQKEERVRVRKCRLFSHSNKRVPAARRPDVNTFQYLYILLIKCYLFAVSSLWNVVVVEGLKIIARICSSSFEPKKRTRQTHTVMEPLQYESLRWRWRRHDAISLRKWIFTRISNEARTRHNNPVKHCCWHRPGISANVPWYCLFRRGMFASIGGFPAASDFGC